MVPELSVVFCPPFSAQARGEVDTQRLKERFARDMNLPVVHGKVSFPDLRIEYKSQEREIARAWTRNSPPVITMPVIFPKRLAPACKSTLDRKTRPAFGACALSAKS